MPFFLMLERKRGIVEAKARERQKEAGCLYGENHPKQEPKEILPEVNKGQTRDQLGAEAGVCGKME